MEPTQADIQRQNEGYGDLYHRIYSVRIHASAAQVRNVMQTLQADLNKFSPQILARFEKLNGATDQLCKDDKFQIHITGPWNGPVVVSDVNEESFQLLTLEGHMEAGQILFRIRHLYGEEYVFEIESFAKSRDRVVDFFYDKLQLAKAAQTAMWIKFCQAFAHEAMASNSQTDFTNISVDVITQIQKTGTDEWKTL